MCINVRGNYIKLRRLEGMLAVGVRGGARLVNESEAPRLLAFWVLALMSWVDDRTRSGLHLGLGPAEFVVPLRQPREV